MLAARCAGGADQRPQLHERGAGHRRGGRFGRQELGGRGQVGGGGGGPGVRLPGHTPGHQPSDVGVHHRLTLPVRERRHRPRGVGADPGQCEQLRYRAGHLAAVPLHERRWRTRAGAAPVGGTRVGPRPGSLRRAARRPAPPGSASGPPRPATPAAPGPPGSVAALPRRPGSARPPPRVPATAGPARAARTTGWRRGRVRSRRHATARGVPTPRPGWAVPTAVTGLIYPEIWPDGPARVLTMADCGAMNELAITVIGHDRPGIVAQVAQTLADLGINLTDSSMTRLRGHFAMTLICSGEVPAEEVEAALLPIGQDGSLLATVREVRPEAEQACDRLALPGKPARCGPVGHCRHGDAGTRARRRQHHRPDYAVGRSTVRAGGRG